MKHSFKYFILAILLTPFSAIAQMGEEVEMADAFRAEGKIYVVVAIMSIILLGIAGYLFNLDRKISKLEKKD